LAETYRLAKTVAAACAAAKVAETGQSGKAAECCRLVGLPPSVLGGFGLDCPLHGLGHGGLCRYDVLEPIISNTIDLHKMENDALEQKRRKLEEINRLQREASKIMAPAPDRLRESTRQKS
jgi:hypothetical protein